MKLAAVLLVSAWLLYCLFNFLCMLAPALMPPRTPQFDGFRVRVPPDARAVLEDDELEAVMQHEGAHRAMAHPWKNLLRACVFAPAPFRALFHQELMADDAVDEPMAMASALRKMSDHPLDRLRARRLEARSIHGDAYDDDRIWLDAAEGEARRIGRI